MANISVVEKRNKSTLSIDFYPTPKWATRALLEKYKYEIKGKNCLEPACGNGAMVDVLREYFNSVDCYDLHDPANKGFIKKDFLAAGWLEPENKQYDWIITNPPFQLAEEFILKMYRECLIGCASFGRISFLEGRKRYKNLFNVIPPSKVFVFSERVNMMHGRLDKEASSAVCYAWYVWEKLETTGETKLFWFGDGTHKALERESDYDL